MKNAKGLTSWLSTSATTSSSSANWVLEGSVIAPVFQRKKSRKKARR